MASTIEETVEEREARKEAKKQAKKALKDAKLQRRNERLSQRPLPTTFVGQHKWLGGAVDPKTGNIYGIPSHAINVICISLPFSPQDDTTAMISTISLPNEYKVGHFKWLRGIIHNDYLYGIPAWSTHGVLKVRLQPKSKTTRGPRVKLLPLPREASHYETSANEYEHEQDHGGNVNYTNVDRGRWMWHGGQVAKSRDGDAIYCIPSNAEHVLKIHLASETVTEIGPPLTKGQNKWYGGISGTDGAIYGMPYTATGVLRIDPKTDSVEVLGEYPEGGYKWHGGLLAHSTGFIYAFPAHSNEVLCVDTNGRDNGQSDEGNQSWRVSCIPIQRNAEDTDPPDLQYKWLGGAYGADGCIYGMPSDATSILRIDPLTNQATTFGRVSDEKNKWQGGVLSAVDKCVYAVPADMDCVLRIDTDPSTPLSIDMVGSGFQNVQDKWQGGFVAKDDKIYAIPENCNHVMVITPGENPSVEMMT